MRNIIIVPQNSDTSKIQLTIVINFISSKDVDEERAMHSRSDNIEFTSCYDSNEIIDEIFQSLHSKYHGKLEISMKGNDFIFDSVQLMYYKCHKVNFENRGLYIDSADLIKKKKATTNPKNTDVKSFQYAVTVPLNYEEIKRNPDRVSNIKPFIDKYNWKGINYPLEIDDWKTFEKNNLTIALNIWYIKEKEIYPAYVSKHNSTREKQIILLMIPNKEKEGRWHYFAVKKLSTLLHGITSKHKGDFYCLNCLHSFRTENKFKSQEKVCKNKDFCGIVLPPEKDNILEFN